MCDIGEKQLELVPDKSAKGNLLPDRIFQDTDQFEVALRMAGCLAKSTIVPVAYQHNPANCMIAIEVASRVGMSPLMVMQNLDTIQGKPRWSGKFVIAAINNSRRYEEPLQFSLSGEGDARTCYAYTKAQNGSVVNGPAVSIKMAKDEGWFSKSGSKWRTMPELMLQYRAASFFANTNCPDLLMGIQTAEEAQDIAHEPVVMEDVLQ